MHEEARSYPRNLHLYMRTHICLPAELPLKTLPRPAQQATRPFPSTMLVSLCKRSTKRSLRLQWGLVSSLDLHPGHCTDPE